MNDFPRNRNGQKTSSGSSRAIICSSAEELQKLGLDLDFLRELEGPEDWLPRAEAVLSLGPERIGAAIRAAVHLAGVHRRPDYSVIQRFLVEALKMTTSSKLRSLPEDVQQLSDVLQELLPGSAAGEYLRDIKDAIETCPFLEILRTSERSNRERRQIVEQEQTTRMRAAAMYISTKSAQPYCDLARFWNEYLNHDLRSTHTMSKSNEVRPNRRRRLRRDRDDGQVREDEMYDANTIRKRIWKSRIWKSLFKAPGCAERERMSLESLQRAVRFFKPWKDIYDGDFSACWPGPFPLSNRLLKFASRVNSAKLVQSEACE